MKKVAILQSNYIPWKGYFDLIGSVDEVIIYDDMQFTRRDWRNRNIIKTPSGLKWLTVPVKSKGKYYQKIMETEICGSEWIDLHWRSLELNYSRAPFFSQVATWLEPIYKNSANINFISQLNRILIESICNYLDIKTIVSSSWDYAPMGGRTERLIDLCVQAGGIEYVSGPAAKCYIDENIFVESNVKLTWFDYSDYPVYPQLWGEFVHGVSVLDLLFNCGNDSNRYIKRRS